jgi:hypothetical protein
LLDQNKFSLKKIGASIWLLEPLLGKAPQRRSLERLFPERGWKPSVTGIWLNVCIPVWKGFSPRGDGNHIASSVWGNINIVWKGFSPRGDGNIPWYSICDSVEAMPGNAFPREGMETRSQF